MILTLNLWGARFYKHKGMGRMQAGGVLGHLATDEGQLLR